MVDYHTHILPGIDDGSKSVPESLEMLAALKKQGVDTVCLTPHFYAERESVTAFLRRRAAAYEALRPHLTEDLPQVLLGAEVNYFNGISRIDDLPLLRLQGSHMLLLEMPGAPWSSSAVREVTELTLRAEYVVVLAHIERYLVGHNRDAVEQLLQSGVYVQSNADYFASARTKRKAARMLREEQIHVLGSDSHNMGTRAPVIGDALRALTDLLGKEAAEYVQYQSDAYLREWSL